MSEHAFPANHFDLADNEHGMTLRDYFAAKALAALLVADTHQTAPIFEEANKTRSELSVTVTAYYLADAMLAERNKQ